MTAPARADWLRTVALATEAAKDVYEAGAQRVWLCGSLAHGNHWDDRSDIDYATIGLASSVRAGLAAALTRRLGRNVDIVCLEDAPSWLRTQITLEMVAVQPDGRLATPAGRAVPFPVVRLAGPSYPRGQHAQRHAVAADLLHARGARRVLDVGCAQGEFESAFVRRWPAAQTQIHGIDPDPVAVSAAGERLDRELGEPLRHRARVEVGGVSDLADRWRDHDALAAIEVIEHLDESTLDGFARLTFERLRPPAVVLTTPNAEYNELFPQTPGGRSLRHPDHRFEWTRDEMRRWLRDTAVAAGYRAALRGIGDAHPEYGSPTQLWLLTRPA